MKSRPARLSVMALPIKSGNFEVLTVEHLSFAEKVAHGKIKRFLFSLK